MDYFQHGMQGGGHPYYYHHQEFDRNEARRIPSPESVTSVACSSFNFDDVKSNVDEISKEGVSEQRHPVQHPAGNEGNNSEQDAEDMNEQRETHLHANHMEMFRSVSQQSEDGSIMNSISVSEQGDESIPDFDCNQPQLIRPHAIRYPTAGYGVPYRQPMMNNVPGLGYPTQFPPTLQQYSAHPQTSQYSPQQRMHLVNGYSNAPPRIGFEESFSNISAPEPVDTPEYKRENSKESSVNTSSFFVTMNPPSESFENQVPQVKTVSGGINEKTTRPYATPAPQTPQTSQLSKEKVKVFVTYAQEAQNPDHIRTVVQISQTLFKNSIEVTVDVLEETFKSVSISDWLESNIINSNFVLICISPNYKFVVDGQPPTNGVQNENAINTQYIYRRIHAEYISQGSKNYRFIPVLVSGAQVQHIPAWLRDTKVFEWPKDYEDIIYRLFRQERFVRPKPGKAPEHTIQRYSERSASVNSRKSTQSQKPEKSGQSRTK